MSLNTVSPNTSSSNTVSPNIKKALAKFKMAPQDRKEKIARMILRELKDVQDDYQEFVNKRLEQGLIEIDEGKGVPIKEAFEKVHTEMAQKYGQV